MYHDYFDDADVSGLRNPYGPEVPLLPDERGHGRSRLLLFGVVGAGFSVVAGGGGSAPDHVAAAPDTVWFDPAAAADLW